ncbi:Hypothetical predicted protein [Mytilus galloprovincialis]|uniref:Uncharacterized protein n=1 Tax=Mytilus galloprovincialis TaxID=29158 RepID=A0A8B6DIA1_MYTGA|nr:Hypothetical predicted protein [Mytilus galloprovincialis]
MATQNDKQTEHKDNDKMASYAEAVRTETQSKKVEDPVGITCEKSDHKQDACTEGVFTEDEQDNTESSESEEEKEDETSKPQTGDEEGNETDSKSIEYKETLNNEENQKATKNLMDRDNINPSQSIQQGDQNTPKHNISRNDERRKKKKAKKKKKTRIKSKVICQTVNVGKTSNTTDETVPKTQKSTNVKCLLNVFEKSPVTPPEELQKRENCSKKQKK